MRRRSSPRRGSYMLEILVAFVVITVIFVPLVGGFTTSLRQTQSIRSYTAARSVAEAAASLARTEVFLGSVAEEAGADLTSSLRPMMEGTMGFLRDVRVHRTIRRLGTSGRLFVVEVDVTWLDPSMREPRSVHVRTMERSEV